MKVNYSHLLVGLLLPLGSIYAENAPLTPPDAKPGECYAKVVLPAEYETVEEKVLIKEASESISIIPAVYDTVKEEIEVVPATKYFTPIKATFKESVETIEIKPALKTWRRSLESDSAPVSPTILAAISSTGINIADAIPGTCYKEYYTPRKFSKISEDVLVQNQYKEANITPAQFEDGEKIIVIKPISKKLVEVPAQYQDIEEQVLISPEKTMWKKGQNPAQKVSGATGEIMCLVKVPAKYKTIKKRVLTANATTKVEEVPAETKTIQVKHLLSDASVSYTTVEPITIFIEKTKLEKEPLFKWFRSDMDIEDGMQFSGEEICLVEEPAETMEVTKMILDTPATVKEEISPATYEMVETKELVTPAKEIHKPIPEEYKTIKKKRKVTDEHIGWKRILCQTNMSKEVIAKIQNALNERGYDAGTPDGLLGNGTKNALDRFQRENNLATGGITYETLKVLDIKLN